MENNCFSKMQGGFRRDRPTFAKMWSLRNVLEHSKLNVKELHTHITKIKNKKKKKRKKKKRKKKKEK